MIVVIVDAHSKYIDAHIVTSATTASTLLKLLQTFATHGLSCTLVSDNGIAFTSQKFQMFCKDKWYQAHSQCAILSGKQRTCIPGCTNTQTRTEENPWSRS